MALMFDGATQRLSWLSGAAWLTFLSFHPFSVSDLGVKTRRGSYSKIAVT